MRPHIQCLTKACQSLAIPYAFLDKNQNLLKIEVGGKPYLFHSARTPFNPQSVGQLCADKDHTYQLFQQTVSMPKTLAFLDFRVEPKFQKYVRHHSMKEIHAEIDSTLEYPLVVKRNKGFKANNVFLCHNHAATKKALDTIYNRDSCYYDYVALAQEYIPASREYRLVCFRGTPVLAYERTLDSSEFKAGYWNFEEGVATPVEDQETIGALMEVVNPVFETLELGFCGFDIVQSTKGDWYLLEINSSPLFDNYIQTNGLERVTAMYLEILGQL